MSGVAVIGVQSEQNRAEYTTFWASVVEKTCGGGVTPVPTVRCLVVEEVHYPVAECGSQAQSAVGFPVSFMGKIVLNAKLVSTNSILM